MLTKVIRVNRADSAFVYAILESLEGVTSYSTLDPPPGETRESGFRDLELHFSQSFSEDVEKVLEGLRKKITILVKNV